MNYPTLVAFRLNDEQLAALDRAAAAEGLDRSAAIRKAIAEWIRREQDEAEA